MLNTFKKVIKKGFNVFGFEIVRINQVPQHTFMGLKNLQIKTIIDIGANAGGFAQMLSAVYPDANIHCFEPLPKSYQEIVKWADISGGKVAAYNVALGEKEDSLTMHYHVDHNYSSSLLKTTNYCVDLFPKTEKQISISVKQTTLNKWMEDLSQILKPDILIKIDVQGYEDRVIRGGMNLFKKAKACILEINLVRLYYQQASFRDIFLLLDDLGYRYSGNFEQVYDYDGKVLYIDSLFVKNS